MVWFFPANNQYPLLLFIDPILCFFLLLNRRFSDHHRRFGAYLLCVLVLGNLAFLRVLSSFRDLSSGIYFQYFDPVTNGPVYNDAAMDKLDYAIYRAGTLGLKVVLAFTNNWSDFGGMNQYE